MTDTFLKENWEAETRGTPVKIKGRFRAVCLQAKGPERYASKAQKLAERHVLNPLTASGRSVAWAFGDLRAFSTLCELWITKFSC